MFYAAVHKYDIRYAEDVTELHRFRLKWQRDQFVRDDRWHRESIDRNDACCIDGDAFKRGAMWDGPVVHEHETWTCPEVTMARPEPIMADPLTYKLLKQEARQLMNTCRYECGGYINELAFNVFHLVNSLEYRE